MLNETEQQNEQRKKLAIEKARLVGLRVKLGDSIGSGFGKEIGQKIAVSVTNVFANSKRVLESFDAKYF